MSDEWIKTLADRRRVKFTNQELDERAFLTAQVEGNKVVYSIVLSNAKNSLVVKKLKIISRVSFQSCRRSRAEPLRASRQPQGTVTESLEEAWR
jgi:hypothetical protein